MKKIILLGFAIILFAACESNTPVRYTQTSAEIDVIKALIADYEAGNWEAWKSHYSDTAWIFANSISDSLSVDDRLKTIQVSLADVSSYGFQKDTGDLEMVVDDKGRTWVNFWGAWQGTLKANGQEYSIPVHLTLQMVDSKIVRSYGYWDNAPIALALQAIEAAKAPVEEAAEE